MQPNFKTGKKEILWMKRTDIVTVLTGLGIYVVLGNVLLLLYMVTKPLVLLAFGIPSQSFGMLWVELLMPVVSFAPAAVCIGYEATERGWMYGLLGAIVVEAPAIASSLGMLVRSWAFLLPRGELGADSGSTLAVAVSYLLLLLLPLEGVVGARLGGRIRERRLPV